MCVNFSMCLHEDDLTVIIFIIAGLFSCEELIADI
jgi:hypothetical protein